MYKSLWLFRIIGFFTWPLGLHYVYAALWKRLGYLYLGDVLGMVGMTFGIELLTLAPIPMTILSLIDVFIERVDGHRCEMR